MFDAGGSEELRACLTQELVLRGAEVRHPWAGSPHWPCPCTGKAWLLVGGRRPRPTRQRSSQPPWTTGPRNPTAASRQGRSPSMKISHRTPSALRCADKHRPAGHSRLEDGLGGCSAMQAWQQLFTAASAGGAYNSGEFGAYGRLLGWRSGQGADGCRTRRELHGSRRARDRPGHRRVVLSTPGRHGGRQPRADERG